MVLRVVVRVLVRGPGPGRRLAEAVAGLPGPAPPCVGEVGFELAVLGLDVDFGPVWWRRPSQLDALAGAVGAQLAGRRTARRGRGVAGGGVRLGPGGLVGSPFPSPTLDPLVFGGALTPYLAALPFEQLRPLRAVAGRGSGRLRARFAAGFGCSRAAVERAWLRGMPPLRQRRSRLRRAARASRRSTRAGTTMPPWSRSYCSAQRLEPARGALVEVDGPAGFGVDAADGDVHVRAVCVGVGGADRVVAVVEIEAVERAGDGRQHLLLRRGRGALGPRHPPGRRARRPTSRPSSSRLAWPNCAPTSTGQCSSRPASPSACSASSSASCAGSGSCPLQLTVDSRAGARRRAGGRVRRRRGVLRLRPRRLRAGCSRRFPPG